MHFEWYPKKSESNRRKDGITFKEATSALRVCSQVPLAILIIRSQIFIFLRNQLY